MTPTLGGSYGFGVEIFHISVDAMEVQGLLENYSSSSACKAWQDLHSGHLASNLPIFTVPHKPGQIGFALSVS